MSWVLLLRKHNNTLDFFALLELRLSPVGQTYKSCRRSSFAWAWGWVRRNQLGRFSFFSSSRCNIFLRKTLRLTLAVALHCCWSLYALVRNWRAHDRSNECLFCHETCHKRALRWLQFSITQSLWATPSRVQTSKTKKQCLSLSRFL